MQTLRFLPLLALAGVVAACTTGEGEPSGTTNSAVVRSAVHVMEGEDFDVEPTRIVTSRTRSPELAKRVAGDTLVSSRGLLRKIKSVTETNESVAFETEPGILDDVFEEARVRGSVTATPLITSPSDGLAPLTADVSLPKLAIGNHRIPVGEGFIEILEGEIDYRPTLDFDLAMSSSRLDRLKVVAGGEAHTKLKVRYDLKKPPRRTDGAFVRFSNGTPLAETPPYYAVFWAGYVPIVVAVRMRLLAGIDVGVGGDLVGEQSIKADGHATLGLSYENGGWHDVSSRGLTLTHDSHDTIVSQAMYGDVTLTARLDVSFYEVAGPYVGIQAYSGIREERPAGATNATWFTEDGLRGIAGAQVAIFGHAIVGYETTLFDLHEQTPL